MDSSATRIVRICLVGLAVSLLLVGIVSGTLLRHVVQILPIAAAFALLSRRPPWGAVAALPIFVFWLLVMVLIWLFLLGLSGIASGQYTPVEIILTTLMAGFSLVGGARCIRLARPLPLLTWLIVIAGFAALQVVVMWLSFLEPIANR